MAIPQIRVTDDRTVSYVSQYSTYNQGANISYGFYADNNRSCELFTLKMSFVCDQTRLSQMKQDIL